MNTDALKPNVQELQKDVIDLLEQVSSLMGRATNTDLGSDSYGKKYGEFEREVTDASRNVEGLKLRMAIVAPMKAGKSTIINAIVGQEILPSRNAAMTTLPTEIVFNADLTEPTLTLSEEVLSVFKNTFGALSSNIQKLDAEQIQQKIGQHPHLVDLLEEIRDTVGFPTRAKTAGREQIIKILKDLNDIVRLCNLLKPSKDPLGQLMDVPCIETPFLRSQKTDQTQKLGNLVIIDTPGPNEAGENLKLAGVVTEQLRQSSIVLIVLDFTQLKTKAAEEIKKDVQKVIQLRGKENLYVLINKVDQRTEGDMTPEQVQQFVAAEFGIGESSDKDRVFEIAARWAFCATNFLLELQQYPDLDIAQMTTARALAQPALGANWEAKLKKVSIEDLQDEAEFLWNKSGFAPFLEKAINALMESAAPRCMKSALNTALSRLLELYDDIKLRRSAMAKDAEKLQQEINALEDDLKGLERCRTGLQKVDTVKKELNEKLNNTLENLKNEAQVNLKTFFNDTEYQRANFIEKRGIDLKSLFNWLTKPLSYQIKIKDVGSLKFQNLADAEDFAGQAVAHAHKRINGLLENVLEDTEKQIEQARQKLTNLLQQETRPIIERAHKRLNENFDVDLSLPTLRLDLEDANITKPHVESTPEWEDGGYEQKVIKKRSWRHWLWIIPLEETISVKRPDKEVNYYTVSLEELVNQINQSLENSIDTINQGISKYLDEDFQERVNTFFEALDRYLRSYQDSLRQAQSDQKLSLEQKEKLVEEFDVLIPEATKQITKVKTYVERTNYLMPSK